METFYFKKNRSGHNSYNYYYIVNSQGDRIFVAKDGTRIFTKFENRIGRVRMEDDTRFEKVSPEEAALRI